MNDQMNIKMVLEQSIITVQCIYIAVLTRNAGHIIPLFYTLGSFYPYIVMNLFIFELAKYLN